MASRAEQKAATRTRIVSAAARLFRERGYHGIGLDAIMAAAGLTHGGFYAHFPNKEALFEAVIGLDYGLGRQMRLRRDIPGGGDLALDYYLDPEHLAEIGRDCPFVNLLPDVTRVGGRAPDTFQSAFDALLGEFEFLVPEGAKDARERALVAATLTLGAVILAKAVRPELAGQLLRAAREGVRVVLRGQ